MTNRVQLFKELVEKKFNIYNSLFLNLPYRKEDNIGMLLPLLYQNCKAGLEEGKSSVEIMEHFFTKVLQIETEKERIDFLFKIINYVERQVVLFDSVEDAAFPVLKKAEESLSLKELYQFGKGKKNQEKIKEKLASFGVRIVLTAHPTQFYPPPVLNIISRLRKFISKDRINVIDSALQQLGLTSLINSKKPTPLIEAKNIIYFLRYVYYDAIGEFYQHIQNIVGHDFDNPNILSLGFWPGGDRDGNPFVLAETTMDVANELRMTLMKCYYNELKTLEQKITFKNIEDPLAQLRTLLYEAMFNPENRLTYEEIINPLLEIRASVIKDYYSLNLKDIDQLINKVKIFKTHFATLDIRQDHDVHKHIIEVILQQQGIIKKSITELSQQELVSALLDKKIRVNPNDFEEDIVKDTIQNIQQLKIIQQKNGEQGSNRYIISNSVDIFSVLFVVGLFRYSGWKMSDLTVDIIPLFETMEGMTNAKATMQTLFGTPLYKKHVQSRNSKQTIMLGFSDGTKDGGYLKANWSIHKTKETLSEVCKDNDVLAIFFDGRGGPPARGGGKTHRFYAAQGKKIANNEIQITIQGQTITSTYGTKAQFINNSEQMLTAGLSNFLNQEKNSISKSKRLLIEQLSDISFKKYDELKKHDKFIPYLEEMSTLKYYGKANIGSRPAKRGKTKKLELSDLRAISFVGSWGQLKQNVPGYFGLGTALLQLEQAGKLDELKALFQEVPFFKALILNSMMSMSKCSFELTSYMAKNKKYKDFWHILLHEFELSKALVLKISGYQELMEEEPVSKASIEIREKIVLPLLVVQQFALEKISQKDTNVEIYEKIVTRSLYGNINASRNSA